MSVCWGATVTLSPVCTPIGSTFSIEHTITTLSLRSRMTSSSNSPQPRTDWSSSTWRIGEASRPRRDDALELLAVRAMPPPRPPSVKAGRTITGSPSSASAARASSTEWAIACAGIRSPARVDRRREQLAVLGGARSPRSWRR